MLLRGFWVGRGFDCALGLWISLVVLGFLVLCLCGFWVGCVL